MVDDYSDVPNLHDKIDEYVQNLRIENNKILNKTVNRNVLITLLKTERREGLIRARLFGADNSHGQVIHFEYKSVMTLGAFLLVFI